MSAGRQGVGRACQPGNQRPAARVIMQTALVRADPVEVVRGRQACPDDAAPFDPDDVQIVLQVVAREAALLTDLQVAQISVSSSGVTPASNSRRSPIS